MPKGKAFTEKQKKLVKLLTENIGLGKPKTLMEMMLEAGYAEESARQQTGILSGIRDDLDPIVNRLEAHREKILSRMEEKLDTAAYSELSNALDKVIKNIQLLSGYATSRVAVGLTKLSDAELEDIANGGEAGAR